MGAMRSPSSSASSRVSDGSAWASTWPSRFFASSIPHSTASWRAKTSIETSGSRPSCSRMLSARRSRRRPSRRTGSRARVERAAAPSVRRASFLARRGLVGRRHRSGGGGECSVWASRRRARRGAPRGRSRLDAVRLHPVAAAAAGPPADPGDGQDDGQQDGRQQHREADRPALPDRRRAGPGGLGRVGGVGRARRGPRPRRRSSRRRASASGSAPHRPRARTGSAPPVARRPRRDRRRSRCPRRRPRRWRRRSRRRPRTPSRSAGDGVRPTAAAFVSIVARRARTVLASSSIRVASSNRQARIASRMGFGSVQSPASPTTWS